MSGVLSNQQIADLLNLVTGTAMPDTCSIVGNVLVDNGEGGFSSTTVVEATVACRLRGTALQPSERVNAERLGWNISYTVDLPVSVTVTPSHQIIVNGRTFEVTGVIKEEDWSIKQVAVVKEVGS